MQREDVGAIQQPQLGERDDNQLQVPNIEQLK